MSEVQRRYGWKPDLPDVRDFKYSAPARLLRALPPSVDLRPGCPPVYDQGSLGSCSANAIGAAHQFEQIKRASNSFIPSRLFLYYNERVMENTINEDSGAYLRDGMKTASQHGICHETQWPYDISKFTQRPPDACYSEALNHQVITYWSVRQQLDQLKSCLADGYPVVFGFTVYTSFESQAVAQTGDAPMPGAGDKCIGGHAVCLVGYDDATQRFLCRNSWGPGWGKGGYFTLPYAYVTNGDLAADFWTIRMVEVEGSEQQQPYPQPEPDNQSNSPCSLPGLLPAVKAFSSGVIAHSDKLQSAGGGIPSMDQMFEAGFRSLDSYLGRIQKLQEKGKI